MLVLATILPALADVDVQDAHGCLRLDALDLEVRQVLGDDVVDRIGLVARLYGADTWQLSLEVSDEGGVLIWQRVMSVERVDCPYLPALVARSVERGLASVPGWDFEGPARARDRLEIGAYGAVTTPYAARATVGPTLWAPLGDSLGWQFDGEFFGSAPTPLSNGVTQVWGAAVSTGPGVEVDLGEDALRASVRAAYGRQVAVGAGFGRNLIHWRPRFAVVGDLSLVASTLLRASIRLELPIVRLAYNVAGDPPGRVVEPALRLGVTLGIAFPVGRSEGRASDRP